MAHRSSLASDFPSAILLFALWLWLWWSYLSSIDFEPFSGGVEGVCENGLEDT